MFYKIISISILFVFYSIYFIKMILQKRKGIRTNQIGKGQKAKNVLAIELIMKFSTILIVLIELLSIILNWTLFDNSIKIIGVILSMLGLLIFFLAVYTMKDSWRAGISVTDKTDLVSNGIYKISRNPAFLGFDLVYIGILIMYFNWLLFFITIFTVIILHLQIIQEEKHLISEFNVEYTNYKKSVCRYFGRKISFSKCWR